MQRLWIGASSPQKVYAISWHVCPIYLFIHLIHIYGAPIMSVALCLAHNPLISGVHAWMCTWQVHTILHQENPPLNTTTSLVADKTGESGKLWWHFASQEVECKVSQMCILQMRELRPDKGVLVHIQTVIWWPSEARIWFPKQRPFPGDGCLCFGATTCHCIFTPTQVFFG